MSWSDADALGVGESSQGMDADAVGSGLGADALGNIFGPNVDSMRALALERARLGLPALSPASVFHDSDAIAYLNALQQEINQINQNVKNNNTIDAIAAHNQNLIGQRMSNQGLRRGSRPNTGWVQSTQSIDPFNPGVVDIRDPSDVLDLGGGMAGSGAMSGSFTGVTPGNSGGSLMSEGGGEYYIRKPRLAYRNAYDQWASDL
jgi:hypothetical protein